MEDPTELPETPKELPEDAAKKRYRSPRKALRQKTKFKKLRNLMCFEEVHKRLREGHATIAVARFIQGEKGEYLDISDVGLSSILRNYRSTIPAADLLSQRTIPAVRKALECLQEGMDEVAELQQLHELQKKRIAIDYKLEKKMGKLMPSTSYELRLSKDILKDSAAIKMDLGINQRHLGKMDIEANLVASVSRYGNENVEKVVASPESRRKVLSVAEKFMALMARGEHPDIVEGEATQVQSDLVPTSTEPTPEPSK